MLVWCGLGVKKSIVANFGIGDPNRKNATSRDASFHTWCAIFPALASIAKHTVVDLRFAGDVGAQAAILEVADFHKAQGELCVLPAKDRTVNLRPCET